MSGLAEVVEPARDMDISEPKLSRLRSERRWASSDSLEPVDRQTDTDTILLEHHHRRQHQHQSVRQHQHHHHTITDPLSETVNLHSTFIFRDNKCCERVVRGPEEPSIVLGRWCCLQGALHSPPVHKPSFTDGGTVAGARQHVSDRV